MAQLASDDFNRANANDLGANWATITVEGEQIGVTSNHAEHKSLGSGDAASSYSAISWPNDQYSEAKLRVSTIPGEGSGCGHGVAVRIATGGAHTLYRAVVNNNGGGQVEVGKMVAGTFTLIADIAVTWDVDQVLRLEAQGTTLRVYQNGIQIGTNYTDSSIASGRAGVAYSSTADSNSQLDDWVGGDLAGTPISGPVGRMLLLGVG